MVVVARSAPHATAQLAAQPTARDTAEIRAAAVAFVQTQKVRNVGRLRVIADTAWAIVFNPDTNRVVYVANVIGHTFRAIGVRVERRDGKWIGRRFDPSALPR